MAIRYVAPTIEQPTEYEMRQRAARQRNLFGAGRNLSRAFVRQAAIDAALAQQANERRTQQQQQAQQPATPSMQDMQSQFQQRTQGDAARRAAEQQIQAQNIATAESNRQALRSGLLPSYLKVMATDTPDLSAVERAASAPIPAGNVNQAGAAAPVARGYAPVDKRFTLGRTPERENLADAPTRFPEFYRQFVGRLDPEVADARMARIAAVRGLGYNRLMDQTQRSFGPGGYGVTASDPPSDPFDFRFGVLGVDEPVDFSALNNRYRPSPDMRSALRLAAIEAGMAPKEKKKLEQLKESLDATVDRNDFITKYLQKKPDGTEADAIFRRMIIDEVANEVVLRSEGLGSPVFDMSGLMSDPAMMRTMTAEELPIMGRLYEQLKQRVRDERAADEMFFDEEDFGLFSGRQALPAGSGVLEGRITPEMLRAMARGNQ